MSKTWLLLPLLQLLDMNLAKCSFIQTLGCQYTAAFQALSVWYILCTCQFDDWYTLYTLGSLALSLAELVTLWSCLCLWIYGTSGVDMLFSNRDRERLPSLSGYVNTFFGVWILKPYCLLWNLICNYTCIKWACNSQCMVSFFLFKM